MRIKTFARGMTLFVALAVALTVMAVPAVAADPSGIASIRQRTVLAGTPDAPFEFSITNVPNAATTPTGVAPSVNLVEIIPPPKVLYTPIPAMQAPSGWTGRISGSGTFIFSTSTDPILPGATRVFNVAATVGRPTVDTGGVAARRWRVFLSGNQGVSATQAQPDPTIGDGTESLSTTIRVLQVLTTKITAPIRAADNSVTSTQTTDVQLDVFNAGSGTLSVTPDITVASSSGASASDVCPAAQSIAPGATQTFICRVTFTSGSGGTLTLRGNASGTHPDGSATALTFTTPTITVMTAAAFNYAAQSLQPTEVSPGKPFTFRLSVQKTGQVSVDLNKANTTLSFGPDGGPTFTAILAEPAVVPAGGTTATPNNVLLQFVTTTIPANMPANDLATPGRREYTPKLQIRGTDQNDFAVSTNPTITDKIVVDALGPVIDNLTSSVPPSRVEGRTAAASNGLLTTFSGNISDRGTSCGTCPIVRAFIRQFNAAQQPLAAEIPVDISNNQGTLSGRFQGNYSPDALFMALVIIAADPGGNTTTAQSNLLDVDNILPRVLSARTGAAGGTDRRGIIVTLSERSAVNGGMPPSDWVVDGHRTLAAEPLPSPAGFDRVRLTVDPELGGNEETHVTYSPSTASRAFDRVGLLLPNATILATDGIVPALPEVETISGMQKQDDRYWSNDVTPDIVISVEPGDTVSVYQDNAAGGTPGEIDATDTLRCSATADADQTEVTCTPASGFPSAVANQEYTLLARSVDVSGNLGPTADEPLTIDVTAPVIQAAARLVSDLVVTISEPLTTLRGRNNQIDWMVYGSDSGFEVNTRPQSVSGSRDSRTLKGDTTWDFWRLTRIQYLFEGLSGTGTRYADRAGNEMLDQSFGVNIPPA